MMINNDLIRVLFIAFAAVTYVVGFAFFLYRDDLKHFSAGYWAAVAVLVLLAPFLVGIVAGL